MNDFSIGLQVTALGMGLVFLTLIIVMLAIMALDRLFRPKPRLAEEVVAAPVTAGSQAEADSLDEVAAIGVAVAAAMAARAEGAPAPRRARSANPLFAMPEGEDDLPGEVVLVMTVDNGSGVWASAGRLKAIS